MTMLHPEFSVVVPAPDVIKAPLAYPVAHHDADFAQFLNMWIEFKRRDGTLAALTDHWIYGKQAVASAPRWSVIRDVLHWVE